jgi:hypothetical protein
MEWPCLKIKSVEDDALIPHLTDDLKAKLSSFNTFAEEYDKISKLLLHIYIIRSHYSGFYIYSLFHRDNVRGDTL